VRQGVLRPDDANPVLRQRRALHGDPRTIELADRTEIAIVIGTLPAVVPSTADFSNA
jgi:hypothetical protein